MIRQPAVANQFYPGNEQNLKRDIATRIREDQKREKVLALIAPHAGYMYSGGVAGAVYSKAEIPRIS